MSAKFDIFNVDVKFVANQFKVSVRRVQQLAQEGILVAGTKKGHYNFLESSVSYIHYLTDKINRGTATINEERALKLRSDRKMSDLKFSEKKGLLVAKAYAEVCIGKLAAEITKEHDRLLADFKQMGIKGRLYEKAAEAILAVRVRCADIRIDQLDFDEEDAIVVTDDDTESP